MVGGMFDEVGSVRDLGRYSAGSREVEGSSYTTVSSILCFRTMPLSLLSYGLRPSDNEDALVYFLSCFSTLLRVIMLFTRLCSTYD